MGGQHGHGGSRHKAVGAQVGHDLDVYTQQCAVVFHRRFHVDGVPPSMKGQHVFLAVLDPLDRAAQHHGDVGNSDLFGEEAGFFAEASPNVGGHHTNAALRAVQHLNETFSDVVGMLGGVPDGEQVFRRLVIGHQPPGFHGRRGQPLHVEPLPDHPVCLFEGRVHVSPGIDRLQNNIGAQFRVHHGRARLHRLHRVDHRGKRFIVDQDLFDPFPSGFRGFGDDDSHCLAHVTHFVFGQDRMGRRCQKVGARAGAGRHIFHHAGQIIGGKNRDDAGRLAGRRRIDGPYPGMGVGAAQHQGMNHAGQLHIIHVGTASG